MNPDPDPAKNLKPCPDPDPSFFLTLSENNINFFIITYEIYLKNKSDERYNVVKSKIIW